jgi:hypothetical protein
MKRVYVSDYLPSNIWLPAPGISRNKKTTSMICIKVAYVKTTSFLSSKQLEEQESNKVIRVVTQISQIIELIAET